MYFDDSVSVFEFVFRLSYLLLGESEAARRCNAATLTMYYDSRKGK
jgi:hypothetical protein